MPQPSPVQRAHVLPEEGHDCEACLPIPPRSSGREMWIDKEGQVPEPISMLQLDQEVDCVRSRARANSSADRRLEIAVPVVLTLSAHFSLRFNFIDELMQNWYESTDVIISL